MISCLTQSENLVSSAKKMKKGKQDCDHDLHNLKPKLTENKPNQTH